MQKSVRQVYYRTRPAHSYEQNTKAKPFFKKQTRKKARAWFKQQDNEAKHE